MPFVSKCIVTVQYYGAVEKGHGLFAGLGVAFLTKELQSGERIWAWHSAQPNLDMGAAMSPWWAAEF